MGKPVLYPAPRASRAMWRRINAGFENTRATPTKLLRIITNGHPYTSCHLGFRHMRNFTAGQVLSLDYDTEDDASRIGTLKRIDFFKENAFAIYTTSSHTEEAPRARVVFILQEPVRESNVFALAAAGLVHHFNLADRTCKDPVRIFFGSKDAKVEILGNALSLNTLEPIMQAELRRQEEELERTRREFERLMSSRDLVSEDEIEEKLAIASELIADAPDGDRHRTRLRIAKLVGGWVAGNPKLSYGLAYNTLLNASMQNTSSPRSAVERDISSGMNVGLQQPVVIESLYAGFPFVK